MTAIERLDERIRYLAAAPGTTDPDRWRDIVARDIDALRSLLGAASPDERMTITSEIRELEGLIR